MISAMRENAVLDREELDFMWWLLSGRSELLDEPLDSLPGAVRAVAAGLDGALKLRRLPADAHRNIVLRNIENGEPLSLMELIELLGERRTKLATNFGSIKADESAVFPLMAAIKTGSTDACASEEKRTAWEWGGRALLEGAIQHLRKGTANGL